VGESAPAFFTEESRYCKTKECLESYITKWGGSRTGISTWYLVLKLFGCSLNLEIVVGYNGVQTERGAGRLTAIFAVASSLHSGVTGYADQE
jgi:hypothetical protein